MRLMLSLFLAVLGLIGLPAEAADRLPVRIGLFPFHSPQHLITQKEPFRRHLAHALQREAHLETAPSLEVFMDRVARDEYEVVLLPSHLGRLIQQDFKWRPLCKYTPDMTVYLVTRKQGGINNPAEIKGKQIATHDRALLISLVAKRWLSKHGILEQDVEWLETGGVVNSVYSVIAGQADVAVASSSTLALVPQAELDQLRVLGEAWTVPQPYVLVSPKMNAQVLSRVRDACRSYTENGKTVLSDIPAVELKRLDGYAAEARERLWGRSARAMGKHQQTGMH